MLIRKVFLLLQLLVSSTNGDPISLRLAPKESRCVWSELARGEVAAMEVFVQLGGKLKVRLEVRGPYKIDSEGTPVVWDDKVSTVYDAVISSIEKTNEQFATPTTISISAKEGGAYRACVENSHSHFDDEVVTLDWRTIASGNDGDEDELPIALLHDSKDTTSSVADLARRVVALRADLATLREKQARERRRLAHHRAINDDSHISIVEGSLLETAVYVISSLFQIIFVRNWFQGKGVQAVFGSDNV
uniref:GOLD domain-containing protein n=1 Tax=Aureoumbra lagunensis TaxID=44058 RepID=A0A7S3JU80_9STRA|mmetsp:Transcript_3267/g.4531  ORF Transcript_3267/g.4531 Transcript_3267/m.4531 type:complete len:247 (-) Transcript_3267:206-946(-)